MTTLLERNMNRSSTGPRFLEEETPNNPWSRKTIQEEVRSSGLRFDSDSPEWKTGPVPPLPRSRMYHASLVIPQPLNPTSSSRPGREGEAPQSKDQDIKSMILIVGGVVHLTRQTVTNSVLMWTPGQTKWQRGPRMEKARKHHATVVCKDHVYTIGGQNHRNLSLHCVERLKITSLWSMLERQDTNVPSSTAEQEQTNHTNTTAAWTRFCRLPIARAACAATVVQDRYIVIVGDWLVSVHVIDTCSSSNNNNGPILYAGPFLNVHPIGCGIATVGRQIYVVGENSMESLQLTDPLVVTPPSSFTQPLHLSSKKRKRTNLLASSTKATKTSIRFLSTPSIMPTFSSSSSWIQNNKQTDLVLQTRMANRCNATVLRVGCCLVMAGGAWSGDQESNRIQIWDTKRNQVWTAPQLRVPRFGCGMVYFKDHGLILVGSGVTSIQTTRVPPNKVCQCLGLTDQLSQLFACLLQWTTQSSYYQRPAFLLHPQTAQEPNGMLEMHPYMKLFA